MYRYYKDAAMVIVFAGDFSWINGNENLKKEILRLAYERKISFVSNKDEIAVKQAINDISLYTKLEDCFHYDSRIKIKCSMVYKGNSSKIFLYNDDRSHAGGDNNVFIISGRDDADYLLKIISILCIPFQ